MYGSTITDSNNNCVGVTTKLYNKESNSATAACTAFHSSNVAPSGSEFCGSTFQNLIKVCTGVLYVTLNVSTKKLKMKLNSMDKYSFDTTDDVDSAGEHGWCLGWTWKIWRWKQL